MLRVVPPDRLGIRSRIAEGQRSFSGYVLVMSGKLEQQGSGCCVRHKVNRIDRVEGFSILLLPSRGGCRPVLDGPIAEIPHPCNEDVGLHAGFHPRNNGSEHGAIIMPYIRNAVWIDTGLTEQQIKRLPCVDGLVNNLLAVGRSIYRILKP